MMMNIGSKVKTTLECGYYSNKLGTVIGFESNVFTYKTKGRIVVVKAEHELGPDLGTVLRFYENELEVIRPITDPTSSYQYCSKCDILTTNKPNLCCEHK